MTEGANAELGGVEQVWMVVGPYGDRLRCAVHLERLPEADRNAIGVARLVATAFAALVIGSVEASGYPLEKVEDDMLDLVRTQAREQVNAWLAGDSEMRRG